MRGDSNGQRYLEPKERFDEIVARAFRQYGARLADLGYANAYDGPDEFVRNAIRRALDEAADLDFQYTPYGGKTTTRRLIASQLGRLTNKSFNYRDVVLTPGAMAALNLVFRSLLDGDDELIVLTPCWLDYPLYLDNLAIRFRFVPLRSDKHLDLTAISEAITERTRGIIFSQPGCPTGVMLERDELAALSDLLGEMEARHAAGIYLIGDEVHRDIAWGKTPFQSVLAGYPRSVSIYSFGKALFLQGQRIGYVAVSPEMPERVELRDLLQRNVRRMGYCTPTNLMQRAVVHLLDYRPPLEEIARRQKTVRAALTAMGYEVSDADATFFVYVKSPIADDMAFAEHMGSLGVLVLPSSVFHETGYFRISVTATRAAIEGSLAPFGEAAERFMGDRRA